jgi:tetratricopeptide (TPR) repeat protein
VQGRRVPPVNEFSPDCQPSRKFLGRQAHRIRAELLSDSGLPHVGCRAGSKTRVSASRGRSHREVSVVYGHRRESLAERGSGAGESRLTIAQGDKRLPKHGSPPVFMMARCAALASLTAMLCLNAQEAEFRRAMELASEGDFNGAEASLRNVARAHPNLYDVRYRLGLILLRQGKPEEAAAELDAAIKIRPSSALAWAGLAQTRLRLKQHSAAMQAAARATELAATDSTARRALAIFYVEAGKAYRAANEPAKAVNAFQSAFRVNPDQRDAYFELATLFLDHRTPQPAVAILESAVARFSREPEFQRLLGIARYQTGDVQSALAAFFAAVDLDPDADVGYASFETLLPEAGPQMSEIVTRLRAFRSRKPSSPVGHFLLARALAITEAPSTEVEPLLRAAIKADAAFWPAYYELGHLLEKQGKQEEALHALLTAETLKPDYAPVHFGLARLYASAGNRPKALEHRKKHHELQARDREAAARARAAAPALTYRIELPPNGR